MVDGESRIWVGIETSTATHGIAAVDIDTLEGIVAYELPEHPHGISVDYQGYIWGVSAGLGDQLGEGGDRAFRINPDNRDFDIVTGLAGSYTYSDMTGHALRLACSETPVCLKRQLIHTSLFEHHPYENVPT